MAIVTSTPPFGLTEREAAARAARGERNVLPPPTGRTYLEILRQNIFTFINLAILGLGLALALLGEPTDALVSLGVVSVNVAVGVMQEIRAKMILDRIALLVRPAARVLRDGVEREVPPSDLVVGDVVRVTAGDQILADSALVSDGPLEMDESLLTGESATVVKHVGDTLLSGTFCVAGSALVETRVVGESALANRLTRGARAFRRVATPLQQRVDTIIRGVLLVAVSFTVVLVGSALVERGPMVEVVQMAIVIAGLVPNGLILAASAAYAMSAVRVARRGVLVQQANAIDSLSHIDVLCMDKTGTLTTGHPRLHDIAPIGVADRELRSLVATFAASAASRDRTVDAIAAALPAERGAVRREIAFSASRRWSAIELEGEAPLVLGAPEVLLRNVPTPAPELETQIDERTAAGQRVLLFARSEGISDAAPGRLTPLGLVSLSEELRPDARATIERYARAGIRIVLISGDHPNTLRAIARATGLDDGRTATGDDVGRLDDDALGTLATTVSLFARTTPHQKERIVRILRGRGQYVAMVGDGINDVLALKAANLGIALRGGASSARAVADMLLLRDEIAALVPAAAEGRRILRGMRDILRIFLTRVLYAALVIAAVAVIEGAFPLTPTQNALLTLLTVGIPSLAFAAWAPAEPIDREDLGLNLARLVLPAGWTIALVAFVAYVATLVAGGSVMDAQSALTTACVVCGLLFIVFVADETGERWSIRGQDARRVTLALVLLLAYLVVLALPATRAIFDLAAPTAAQLALTIAGAIVWLIVLRWSLRVRLLDAAIGAPRAR